MSIIGSSFRGVVNLDQLNKFKFGIYLDRLLNKKNRSFKDSMSSKNLLGSLQVTCIDRDGDLYFQNIKKPEEQLKIAFVASSLLLPVTISIEEVLRQKNASYNRESERYESDLYHSGKKFGVECGYFGSDDEWNSELQEISYPIPTLENQNLYLINSLEELIPKIINSLLGHNAERTNNKSEQEQSNETILLIANLLGLIAYIQKINGVQDSKTSMRIRVLQFYFDFAPHEKYSNFKRAELASHAEALNWGNGDSFASEYYNYTKADKLKSKRTLLAEKFSKSDFDSVIKLLSISNLAKESAIKERDRHFAN